MSRKPNPWIEHVKKYAKEHNVSYGCAISEAKATYVKKGKSKPTKKIKKMVKKVMTKTMGESKKKEDKKMKTVTVKPNSRLSPDTMRKKIKKMKEERKKLEQEFDKISGENAIATRKRTKNAMRRNLLNREILRLMKNLKKSE